MTEPELMSFLADVGLADNHTSLHKLKGGYLNSVWRFDTGNRRLVAKQFATPMTGTLFPNLPEDEAEELRRLSGFDVAPDLVGFWPEALLLVYDYVDGEMWNGDMAGVARLLKRKEIADPTGFRDVPVTFEEILSEGDALFSRCKNNPAAPRPGPCQLSSLEKRSLIHTDIGANLVGEGDGLRLIDWQCPAAGDVCEDIYSFLSPAFNILAERNPLTEEQVAKFWQTLNRPDLMERYTAIKVAFAWRFAGYCAWRAEVHEDADVCARYQKAVEAELTYMKEAS